MYTLFKYFLFFQMAVISSYLIRFEFFSLKTNMLDVLLCIHILFLFFFLFAYKNTKKEEIIQNIQQNIFFYGGSFLLFTGLFLSALGGGIQSTEWGIIKSWFILPFLFSFLFFLVNTKKRIFLEALQWYGMGAFGVAVFALGGEIFLDKGVTYDLRLRGWFESPNHLAMILSPAFLFFWIQFRCKIFFKTSIFTSRILLCILGILGVVILLTKSHGAILSLIVTLSFIECFFRISTTKSNFFLLCTKYKKYFLGILISVLFLGGGSFFVWEQFSQKEAFQEQSSFASRIVIWRVAWNISIDHWFFGIGPGNFQEKYLEYQIYYPPYPEWAVPQSHNIFLAFWLQTGLLGFLGFILLFFSSMYRAGKSILYLQKKEKKSSLMLALFGFSFCIVTLLWGMVDTLYWKNDLSLLFWFIIFSILWNQVVYTRRN
ncbi:MAG: hypothetical protein EOM19_02550 [Candidatus Moranbacteria bacterium]|nr:hypothetical protein [Candidatus Moranbacteria bacterium]